MGRCAVKRTHTMRFGGGWGRYLTGAGGNYLESHGKHCFSLLLANLFDWCGVSIGCGFATSGDCTDLVNVQPARALYGIGYFRPVMWLRHI